MRDLSREVSLYCPSCGNNLFSTIDENDEPIYQCSACKNVFSKSQLLEENEEIINANIEDIRNEAIKEFDIELRKSLKKLGFK